MRQGTNSLRRLVFFIFFLLLSAGAWAQDVPPRRVMVFFRGAEIPAAEKHLLSDAFMIALQDVRQDVFIVEGVPAAGPETDDERSSLARRRACDSWLTVNVSLKEKLLSVEYLLYDIVNEHIVKNEKIMTEVPDARDRTQVYWKDIASSVNLLPPLDPLPSYVVKGVAGTEVFGFGKPVTLDETGTARVTVKVPDTYEIRAEKLGYSPLSEQYLLKEKGGEIVLAQQRGALVSFDMSLYNAQFPSFSMGLFAIPDSLYFKIGLTSFSQGIGGFLFDSSDESRDYFVSYPLMHLEFYAGIYLSPADAPVRTYLGAGAFLRVFFAETETMLDPIMPYGFNPVAGIEYAPSRNGRVFLEYAPAFYYLAERDLLGTDSIDRYFSAAVYPADYALRGMALLETVWFDPFVFRLGYRWQL